MPKPPMTSTDAAQILRGQREIVTPDDEITIGEYRQAGHIILTERDRLIVIAVCAGRLIEAADDDTSARARRRLVAALDRWH